MQQESPFKNLQEEEIASALDIEAKPSSEKGEKSPDVSGIFMRKAEDLKREHEERKQFIERAKQEEAALKKAQVTDLRAKISGKKQVEVTGEAAQKWQEYLETTKDLQASRHGETTYGGTVENPMEATATHVSETSFEKIDPPKESGERPAMFNLAEMARQEEEAKKRSQDPPSSQRAA